MRLEYWVRIMLINYIMLPLTMLPSNEGSQLITVIHMAYHSLVKEPQRYNDWFQNDS